MNDLQAAVRDRRHVEASRLTVAGYLQQWIEGLGQDRVRGGTRNSYEGHIRLHLIPHIGDVRLRDLTGRDVRALYATLRERGAARGGGLSPKTVHNAHVVLHKALADAVRERLLLVNPADGAHRLPPRREMRTWPGGEVRAFLTHVADDRLAAS